MGVKRKAPGTVERYNAWLSEYMASDPEARHLNVTNVLLFLILEKLSAAQGNT